MTAKQRFFEYSDARCSITEEEFDSFTLAQWGAWCSAWDSYVTSGGVRPAHRPPV